jgi:cobalt/nickel transport system permease protein
VSHLHIPDGLLPVWAWTSGLVVVLALLLLSGRSLTPQRIAYQGALGGLMLATNALPLGPLEYHLTLAGPVGILLGPGGGIQAAFVVSSILALMGHGGLTVVGLNALVLGTGSAVAFACYGMLARALRPAWAMAWATAAGQALAGALWMLITGWSLRGSSGPGDAPGLLRLEVLAGLALPLWLLGIAVESVVAFGIGRFLERVHPALLPRPAIRALAPTEVA